MPGLVARYGPRAPKVVKDTIKRLRASKDESGVRMWTLIAEALPDIRRQPTMRGRLRHFE
jgi:hypothetical protein